MKILLKFEKKWIALSEDNKKVLVSGESVIEVEKKLKKEKILKAKIMYIPEFDKYIAPYGLN